MYLIPFNIHNILKLHHDFWDTLYVCTVYNVQLASTLYVTFYRLIPGHQNK
jgi:hypothetical protein